MRGAGIGTIVPWTGDGSTIPDGWMQCNGQILDGADYPVLASVLGNTYGGNLNGRAYDTYVKAVDTFQLPQLNGRVLTDYEQAYVSETALQMGQNYANGAVGGIVIISGEIDTLRTPATYNFTGLTSAGGGSGLDITIDVDVTGRAGITKIVSPGQSFTINDELTIPKASLPSGQDDLVLKISWTLPSVASVITPTGTGNVQLIDGDGSGVTPATSANAVADINFNITDSSNLAGQIRNFSVNPPSYFKTFYTIPRKLSKDHMPAHRHANPSGLVPGYSTAIDDGGQVEAFQCPGAQQCCENNQKEKVIVAGEGGDIDYFNDDASQPGGYGLVTRFQSGVTLVDTSIPRLSAVNSVGTAYDATNAKYGAPQPVWSGPIPRPIGATYDGNAGNSYTNPKMSSTGNLTSYKNWYGYENQANDVAANLFTPGSPQTSKTFPVCLNHNREKHPDIDSHSHYTFEVTMNAGYLRPPTIVPVNDIQVDSTASGSPTTITPQNLPSALNINVDVKTPALSMLYIIRAF